MTDMLSARLRKFGFTVSKGQEPPRVAPGMITRHNERVIVGPLQILAETAQTFSAELSSKLIEEAELLSKQEKADATFFDDDAPVLSQFRRTIFDHIVLSLSAAGYAVGDDVDKIKRCLRCDVFVVAGEDFEARNAFTRVMRFVFSALFGMDAVPIVNTVFVSALPNNAIVSSVFEYAVNDDA